MILTVDFPDRRAPGFDSLRMLVFSSTQHSPQDAFAMWRSAISEQFVPLRPEPVRPLATFFAELRRSAIGPLTLSEVRSTGQHVHRDRAEIARSRAETLFLNVQVDGESGLVYGDRAVSTRRGDLFIVDGRRPFLLACETPMRHLCLAIPREALPDRSLEWDRTHGLAIHAGQDTVTDLLRDYLCSLAAAGDGLEQQVGREIADHVMSLVAFVTARYRTDARLPREAVRAAVFARACRVIDRRLCDPDFDPAALAQAMRVSLRYLQLLFQEHATSPMREIVRRRVALSMRVLRDAAYRHRTITDIAFASGFSDASHFGRVFVATTGQTPREWRRQGILGLS